MEEALVMGKASARGGLRLFIGTAASNVIMAVGTIVLARLLSTAEYGLYAVAMTPALLFTLFRDWGMDSAITKYIAHFRVSESEEDAREIVVAGVIFEAVAGLVLCLLLVFLSGFIASAIHRPEAAHFISVISVTVFSGSLLTVAQSSFVGFERMGFSSITTVSQAIVKSVASPLLVILGFGVLGPVLGYTLSFVASAAVGLALLYFLLFRNLKRANIHRKSIRSTLRIMLHYGVPLSIAAILEGFLGQFYGFMMVIYVSDNTVVGNFQIATTFAVLLTFFAYPIQTVLFPAFAKLNSRNDQELLRTVFKSSVKYSSMFLVPATAALMVLSQPVIYTLFGEKWIYAPLFLTVYVVSYIFQGLGNLSIGGFLRGLGQTRTLLMLDLVSQLVGIPLAFMLIPTLGMMGVIAGPILASIPSVFLGFYWIWKNYSITADWGCSAKILAASAVAAGATYVSLTFFHTAAFLRLIAGGLVFLLVFIVLAPSIGAIAKSDTINLKSMFSGLGLISRITGIFLNVVEKVANSTRFSRKEQSQ